MYFSPSLACAPLRCNNFYFTSNKINLGIWHVYLLPFSFQCHDPSWHFWATTYNLIYWWILSWTKKSSSNKQANKACFSNRITTAIVNKEINPSFACTLAYSLSVIGYNGPNWLIKHGYICCGKHVLYSASVRNKKELWWCLVSSVTGSVVCIYVVIQIDVCPDMNPSSLCRWWDRCRKKCHSGRK